MIKKQKKEEFPSPRSTFYYAVVVFLIFDKTISVIILFFNTVCFLFILKIFIKFVNLNNKV